MIQKNFRMIILSIACLGLFGALAEAQNTTPNSPPNATQNTAQNNLSKLSEETGGKSFYLGTSAPVSFKPYLDELQVYLDNQYLLSFAGDGGAKGKFVSIRLKTELAHTEFLHANQAWLVPAK